MTTTLSIPQLRAELNGRVITADDDGYDEARAVFYRSVDRRPALIIRPADATEVSLVVSLARDTGAELAVRSGGHSLAGHSVSEGGIVLDLVELKALDIDAHARTAWAQTGLTAAEYTAAAGAHGLATGFGDTGTVGIGGLALGGGVGFLVRKHGLTIDDLLAAELVTADGEMLYVDAETHPDLFWAIRGGGGNFGVATRFQFRLHQVDTIVGGMLILPATPDVIASFVAEAEAAPEELSAIANIMVAPPMPFLPAEAHGKPVVMVLICYAGEVGAGERALAPFRTLTEPVADMVRQMRYPEIYTLFGDEAEGPGPAQEVARSLFVDAVDSNTGKAILDHLQASTAPMAVAQLRVLGGAMARVAAEDTAFAHRRRRVMVAIGAVYERAEESPVHEAWVADFAAAFHPDAGVYVNFLGDEGEERVLGAYPGPTWDRLVAVKSRYDPTNLFRLNQNIPPA
jgi:FAD/FMN-containing dehydrogenase